MNLVNKVALNMRGRFLPSIGFLSSIDYFAEHCDAPESHVQTTLNNARGIGEMLYDGAATTDVPAAVTVDGEVDNKVFKATTNLHYKPDWAERLASGPESAPLKRIQEGIWERLEDDYADDRDTVVSLQPQNTYDSRPLTHTASTIHVPHSLVTNQPPTLPRSENYTAPTGSPYRPSFSTDEY